MGWAFGVNAEGREVGYGVEATCDFEGCDAKIDRGLYYVCGGMHDGDEHGCGRYFCGSHLGYWFRGKETSPQLCEECGQRWQQGEPQEPEEEPEGVPVDWEDSR